MIFLLAQPAVWLCLSRTWLRRWNRGCFLQCHASFHQSHKLSHLIELTELRRLRNEILIFKRLEWILMLKLRDEELEKLILAEFFRTRGG